MLIDLDSKSNDISGNKLSITAIEPMEGMRNEFLKISILCSSCILLDGSSTNRKFPDNCFDIVFIAQAFH